MSRIAPDVVDAVHQRAGGYCEACTMPLHGTVAMHHRRFRSRGGADTAANLVLVHEKCHLRIHRWGDWATEHGLTISRYDQRPDGDIPVIATREMLTLHE